MANPRTIASHRYVDRQQSTPTNVQLELATEFRNLLLGDDQGGRFYERYVNLIPPLLECNSAYLLYTLDNTTQEIAKSVIRPNEDRLTSTFRKHVQERATNDATDILCGDVSEDMQWTREAPHVLSYASIPIIISGLELCILVAADDRSRAWSDDERTRLRDVSQMLVANMEVTRERHLISVQRRMQRSLVSTRSQFFFTL